MRTEQEIRKQYERILEQKKNLVLDSDGKLNHSIYLNGFLHAFEYILGDGADEN